MSVLTDRMNTVLTFRATIKKGGLYLTLIWLMGSHLATQPIFVTMASISCSNYISFAVCHEAKT